MERQSYKAQEGAGWLEQHPAGEAVTDAGLKSSP